MTTLWVTALYKQGHLVCGYETPELSASAVEFVLRDVALRAEGWTLWSLVLTHEGVTLFTSRQSVETRTEHYPRGG